MGIIYRYCKLCNENFHEDSFYFCIYCHESGISFCELHKLYDYLLCNKFIKISHLFCSKDCEIKFNINEAIENIDKNKYLATEKDNYIKIINLIEKIKNDDEIKKIDDEIKKIDDEIEKKNTHIEKLKVKINNYECKKLKIIRSL